MRHAATLLFISFGLLAQAHCVHPPREDPGESPRSKTRVLYVEATPRWEYRHLKDLLMRDPSVALHCYLTSADEDFPQESSRGLASLKALPDSSDALGRYDLVILGALPSEFHESRDPDFSMRLAEFVEKQGGGLIILAGEGLHASPGISEILPVTLPLKPEFPSAPEPLSLELTAKGFQALFLRLDDDAERNRQIWQHKIPPQRFCPRGVEAKAGSDVLLVCPGGPGEGGPIPVIVSARFGRGRSLFIGTDESWRWRAVSAGRWYDRFWRQVIAYVARSRKPKGYFLEDQEARSMKMPSYR